MKARLAVLLLTGLACARAGSGPSPATAVVGDARADPTCVDPYREPFLCEFRQRLAQQPALALARPESVTIRFSPDSAERLRSLELWGDSLAAEASRKGRAELRHVLVARPGADTLVFESRITNVGDLPVGVVKLCRPRVLGTPWQQRRFIGTGCYGTNVRLQPGDSLVVRDAGHLRGTPGRHRFEVHAVDPPGTYGRIELVLIAWRGP